MAFVAVVADNSVVLAWFIQAQSTPYVEKLLRRVVQEAVHVPVVWPLEFANALRQFERRRKLKPEGMANLLVTVHTLGLKPDASPPTQARLLDLARQYGLSIYDASYLELAIRLALPLATQDAALAGAAGRAGLRVGVSGSVPAAE